MSIAVKLIESFGKELGEVSQGRVEFEGGDEFLGGRTSTLQGDRAGDFCSVHGHFGSWGLLLLKDGELCRYGKHVMKKERGLKKGRSGAEGKGGRRKGGG